MRPVNYRQTLQYLYSQMAMYQRIGSAAYKDNLDNTIAICNLLKNPQHTFKSIHIAGTNGKGSTSHLLASVLQSAGYKVGLYTSPHLKDFRERIRINGKMIPQKTVVDFVHKHQTVLDQIQPSFFEVTVGLAFDYFAKQKVDIAVIEVGLGGRLDSTNVISPLVSVITNISLDHQNILGNTLQKIAIEKAGIIKPGIPVVIGETQKEIRQVFIDKANKSCSTIYFADKTYKLKNVIQRNKKGKLLLQMDAYRSGKLHINKMLCELPGLYQIKNIQTVLMVVELLNNLTLPVANSQIKNGLENIITQTGLLGRWQVLSKSPLTIADTGHNEAGITEVLRQLKLTPHNKLLIVLGMVNDKSCTSILKLLPKRATYYFCKPNLPRGLEESKLMEQANKVGLKGRCFSSVKKALKAAKGHATANDVVFVGGSNFVVAEVV